MRPIALIAFAAGALAGAADAQDLDPHPRILSGYTGAFLGDEDETWRDYLPLLAQHGFTTIDLKLHPADFDMADPAMREFVHTVAGAVYGAGLEFSIYLYDRGAERDPADPAGPAFVGPDGVVNEQMHCIYTPETWLNLFERVFYMAERSLEVPIAAVKIDVEHLQNYTPCVCDECFGGFARRRLADEGLVVREAPDVAPAERWGWIEQHGGEQAYLVYLESRIDEAAVQYERRAHAINPDLRLGIMPIKDTLMHRPWIRHLATERAPAIMDSWVMYGGMGWTEAAAEVQTFVKGLNPSNLFVPWFRPNTYRPEDMGAHAFVAAVMADGYNLWQLNMLHPEQPAANRPAYALPADYTDPMLYWRALGKANARVREWLAAPREITWEPIEMLVAAVDVGGITIPDLARVTTDLPDPEAPLSPTSLRGVNTLYVYIADPTEPIRIDLRHAAGDARPRPIGWALVAEPGAALAEGQVQPGKTAELSLQVPAVGTYAFAVQATEGGGPWYSVRVHSHPYGIDASSEAYLFRRNPPQYFHVPAGCERFSMRASTGGRNQEMRVRVWRPDGELALDDVVRSDEGARQTLEIAVPAGMDGAVWSVALGAPEQMPAAHYSENYWLRIIDASPYLADRPGAVLAPAAQ